MHPSRPIVACAGGVAAVLLCAGAHPAAACFEHTFEPCPTQTSRDYVVELDRKVGEAVDIYVNNRLVARGEVVVVEDRLGVTMTEIIKADRA